MAGNEQGTGHHKHKSTEEPFPHHEAPTTSGEGSHSGQHASGRESKGEEKGSGSRGEDKGSGSREERGSSSSKHESGSSRSSESSSSESDLRSREYTGPDGQEHHHTKTYMEQHKGEKGDKKSGA